METRLDKIVDSLYFSMTEITYISKLINYFYNRKKVVKIDEILNQKVFNRYKESQDPFIEDGVKLCNSIASIFRLSLVLCVGMYFFYPLLDKNILLPFPGWFFFDKKKI